MDTTLQVGQPRLPVSDHYINTFAYALRLNYIKSIDIIATESSQCDTKQELQVEPEVYGGVRVSLSYSEYNLAVERTSKELDKFNYVSWSARKQERLGRAVYVSIAAAVE